MNIPGFLAVFFLTAFACFMALGEFSGLLLIVVIVGVVLAGNIAFRAVLDR